ncbi:WD40-repeat-containing domain protein [Radiomyces spectabilis]|uniref:WD40-repeat-containing domain protein n=1 Tax=Radiomyces spectabilis TaxID=64574 RepID=UPI0022209579|nr:WD40-repeat-containing domain protein [Radiomyces spectabilis]KAI8365221.1 WD40-repeat-containing domain protein [Radiomyces spectabilis]
MIAKTLEINWHDGQAIYSADFSPDGSRYATAGADTTVRIWSIHKRPEADNNNQGKDHKALNALPVNIDFLSELKRHSSPVNVVRFSPNGEYLASAGDDACIILWKISTQKDSGFAMSDYSEFEKETWNVVQMFYGHNKEIYDLAWSPCGKYFITAAIDNTARVWSIAERQSIHVFADHTHYVQGVAWDPEGQFVATQSSDRSLAIYRYKQKPNAHPQFTTCQRRHLKLDKSKIHTNKASVNEMAAESNNSAAIRLYHDENLVSFFRRLAFSPDGAMLITPAGLCKNTTETLSNRAPSQDSLTTNDQEDYQNCAYIYPRNTLLKHPLCYVSNFTKPSIAIRWCPMLFQTRPSNKKSLFMLPYRMVYAVATQDSVYIYDTQQTRPICAIRGMHFAPITDIAWSHDGSMLMFSSADGYCSSVVFKQDELGISYQHQRDRARNEHDIEMMDVSEPVAQPAKPASVTDVRSMLMTSSASSSSSTLSSSPLSSNNNANSTTSLPKAGIKRITPILVSANSPADGLLTQKSDDKSKKRRIIPTLISAPASSKSSSS